MKTWESRARSSRMALAPKPSACRLRMSVAMSEPLMDARERRAKGRAAKVFTRFFSRATVGFLGRRDLTEVTVPGLSLAGRCRLGARNEDPTIHLPLDLARPDLYLGFAIEWSRLRRKPRRGIFTCRTRLPFRPGRWINVGRGHFSCGIVSPVSRMPCRLVYGGGEYALSAGFYWCRERGSNPHGISTTGF